MELDELEGSPLVSSPFTIPGEEAPHYRIGWINGINNTFKEAEEHGKYLQTLAEGRTISAIYNCSHTPLTDLLEVLLFNYQGYSPLTQTLLQHEWRVFHEENLDQPDAKYLQICHSQGALHVKNALQQAEPAIRNRLIVIAIAPASIIPSRLCFQSFNYVSTKDLISRLTPPPVLSIRFDEVIFPTIGSEPLVSREWILLSPHPEAAGIDHTFQSPTFRSVLEAHLVEYIEREGVYIGLKDL